MTTETINNTTQGEPEKHPLEELPSFEEHLEGRKVKTWQEKAKEKNYYQDENGDWWEKFEDGWGDEEVPAFKLDIEYPALADLVEESAEKHHIALHDSLYGLKQEIYDRAEDLSKLNPETIDNMFIIFRGITHSTSGTDEIVLSRNEEDTRKSLEKLTDYYRGLSDEARTTGDGRYIGDIAEHFIRDYHEDLATDQFMSALSHGANMAQTAENHSGYKVAEIVKQGIRGFSRNRSNGDLFGGYLDYAMELSPDGQNVTKYDDKCRVFTRYVGQHGFNQDTISGFENNIFPLLEQRDPEVEPILNGGNAYGTTEYGYGIADYTEECLLSRCTPRDIDRLNRIYHELPTTDYYKFEQNRQDAGRIQGIIIGGRDFIHDERLGVHEILSTMEKYYDAEDEDSRSQLRDQLVALDQKYPYAGFLDQALNLENYEKTVEKMAEAHVSEELRGKTAGNSSERAIDILRRLVENTSPEQINAPKTKHEELNRLLENIDPLINSETGETKVSLQEVAPAVTELNRILSENQNEQGVFPSTISAISYLDKMSANVLRGFSQKDLQEAIFDLGFKEILRFSQLTSSPGYHEVEFDAFYQRAVHKFGKAYHEDDIDSDEIREGWRFVGQKTTENMANLAKTYAKNPATERFVPAIWSGNLSHELIGAFERV